MYRIDKFLEYYNSLKGNQVEIEKGVWAYAKPLPFYYGILTRGYWKQRKQRREDAKAVRQGKAIAVTWER
jgi:hypothetical protein